MQTAADVCAWRLQAPSNTGCNPPSTTTTTVPQPSFVRGLRVALPEVIASAHPLLVRVVLQVVVEHAQLAVPQRAHELLEGDPSHRRATLVLRVLLPCANARERAAGVLPQMVELESSLSKFMLWELHAIYGRREHDPDSLRDAQRCAERGA